MSYSKAELPILQPLKGDSIPSKPKTKKLPKLFNPINFFSKLTNKFKSPSPSPKGDRFSESVMSSEPEESPRHDQSHFTIDISQTNSPYDSMERHNFTEAVTLNQLRAPGLQSINQVLSTDLRYKPKLGVCDESIASNYSLFPYENSEYSYNEDTGGKGRKKLNLKLNRKKLDDYEFDQILEMGFFDEDTKEYKPTRQVSLTPRVAW